MTVPALSFRLKLILAMMLTVAAATGAALLVTERGFAATYRRIVAERFESDVASFAALQQARLAAVQRRCLELARSVRLVAAFEEADAALLYPIALDELRDVLRPDPATRAPAAGFFRLLGPDSRLIAPDDQPAGLVRAGGPRWEAQIAQAVREWPGDAFVQQVGYVAPEVGGRPALHEVVVTRIVDPVARRALGALALGFPVDDRPAPAAAPALASILGGIWFEGRLHSHDIPADVAAGLAGAAAGEARGDAVVDVGGEPHRVFSHVLHPESRFPPAHQVALYSTAAARAEQGRLQRTVLGFGVLALLLGLALSLVISRGLAVPVRRLVAAAEAIGRGDFATRVTVRARDEMGRLAAAFNDMAEGLALKERYRSVLDLVADRRIADELVGGRLQLGGEPREVTILFCDVRAFTALTEGMPPDEVVQLLNEHMTALARVVHAHHGVVDKYIGDGLMALFGAPRSTGADAVNAVRAAWDILRAREELNRGGSHPMPVGIGVASGLVVAGCMGSSDRLSYTVIGERVNLAARLCAQAGPMEVVIDEATLRAIGGAADVDVLPSLTLKGFSTPVVAYRVRGIGGATLAS